MKTSINGLKFIQSFEGCILHPYLDQGGTATIGFGFTFYPGGRKVTMSDPALTQAEADDYFEQIVSGFCVSVLGLLTITPTQNQIDSLTDFAYNLGIGAFQSSTLLQHVNQKCVVEEDFTIYDHIGKEVSVGLLARRKAEYELFISASNQSTTMENTSTVQTNVTPETPQTLIITAMTVTYQKAINGQVVDTRTVNVVANEAVCAALQADPSLAAPGWNISVVPNTGTQGPAIPNGATTN